MMQDHQIAMAAEAYETALLSLLSEKETDPHRFTSKFEEKMEKLCRKVKHKPTLTIVKRVAVIVLISALLAGSLAMTNPTVRASVYNWLKAHFEGVFMFVVGDGNNNYPIEYEITWFPGNYSLVSQESVPRGHTFVYKCPGKPDIVFTAFYKSQGSSQIMFDTPTLVKKVTVSGAPAEIHYFSDRKLPAAILWNTEWGIYQFLITADLDDETLVKLAESVTVTRLPTDPLRPR